MVKLDVIDGAEAEREAQAMLALKHSAASALERAMGFVDAQGGALARSVLAVHFGQRPASVVVDALAEQQRSDGGIAPLGWTEAGATGLAEAPLAEPLRGSLEALIILADLGALHAEMVAPLARFIGRAQNPDGSFGETSAPDVDRIFSTGMLCGLIGRTKVVRPEILQAAGEFLGGLWSPEQVENGNWAAITGFGAFFSGVSHDLDDEAMQWVGRELDRAFRTHRFDAAQTARVLTHCDASAMPGCSIAPPELLERLLGEQAGDGGFDELSMHGAAGRVVPTLDAVLVILRLCSVMP